MDIIYSGLTLLKEMNWFISSFIYIPQSTIFQEFIVNESIKWNIYQKWKLIEMTSKEKLSTNLNIFNTGFFLIHENWSVLMLMKWQLWQKCYYLLPWIFLHVVYIWYSHYFLWICFSEKCFVSKLSKYLWGFPVYSIYNNAFMTFVLSFFCIKIWGRGLKL